MAKNVTVTPADGDIQFENSSGTAAGRIEQNGDDLVISNAVGDVLFGDANADVYIGDGVNSVDLLFEQSGSVKAEDGSTGVTLTLGSSDTILSLYAPQLTTTMTIGTSGSIDYTPDTGTVLSFDGQSIIRRLNANGGVSIGHDDQVIIAGGDTSSTMDSNVTGEVVAIGAEGGLLVYGFPNNNTAWTNRVQFSFNNDGKMYFGTASDTNIYRSAANTLKTDDSFEVGSTLLLPSSHSKSKIKVYGSGNEWIGTSTGTLELSGGTVNLNGASGTGTPNFSMGGTTVITSSLALQNVSGNISMFTNDSGYSTFDGAYSSLSGIPSTFAPSSHNHDGRYYTESESDQRFPRGRTVTYSDAEDSGGSDAWYKIFQITDSGSTPVECHIRGYAHTSLSFVVSEGYLGGHAHINILDALSSSTNNNYKFIEGVRVASNGDVEILLNGGSNVSIEMTLIGDATPVSALVVSTTEAENIKDSVTVLSNGMMRTYGKLYIGDTDTNTTSTTALVLNGEKVDSRTLGSNAFTSYSDHSTQGYLTAHPAVTEATTNLSNSGRTYIQSITLDSNGHVTGVSTGTETVTNTNTTYSAGSGLDLTSTTFSVEADLRDGITHVGKDTNNYITFDSTNGRIDFYAGGNFVARMESDGDLHIKGDVIAFSNIFG